MLKKLLAHDWPGNARELRNCIERAVALTRFERLQVADLPLKLREYKPRNLIVVGNDPSELIPLEELERRYIAKVLEVCDGNKSVARAFLG